MAALVPATAQGMVVGSAAATAPTNSGLLLTEEDTTKCSTWLKKRRLDPDLTTLLGATFLRRFTVHKVIADDGYGLVFKCFQADKWWAVKVAPIFAGQGVDDLQREVAMLGKVHEDYGSGITHPLFVHLDSVFFNDTASALCLKMPLLAGGDLCDNLTNLNFEQKRSVAAQLVQALSWLQTRNPKIVHRDLKPENIFVKIDSISAKVSIKLIDFGMARTLEEVSGGADSAGGGGTDPDVAAGAGAGMSKTNKDAPKPRHKRKKTKYGGTPGYKPPEAFTDDYGVEVDNFAVGKTLMVLFFETTRFLSMEGYKQPPDEIFTFEDVKRWVDLIDSPPYRKVGWGDIATAAKAAFACVECVPSAVDFVHRLCHRERSERMTMGEAAKHEWLGGVDLSVPLPHPHAGAGPRTSDMIAPLRGASLAAVQEFLRRPEKRETSLKTNLFGVMVRFDEFELGSEKLKAWRHKQELALLLYMYDAFAKAENILEDVISWCNEEAPKDNDLVEQLHVQSLSQMVSTRLQLGKKSGEPVILDELVGQLHTLSLSQSGNRVNNQRVYLMARFKLIEVCMGQANSAAVGAAEAAKAAKYASEVEKAAKNEKAAQMQKALDEAKKRGEEDMQDIKGRLDELLKELGCDETKDSKALREAIEISSLIVENRLFDLELKQSDLDETKCKEICGKFERIYESRKRLYGGHAEARLVIQSAKNCGDSYKKLAIFFDLANNPSAESAAKATAIKFYAEALNGQREYMGEDDDPKSYYQKIVRKLKELVESHEDGDEGGGAAKDEYEYEGEGEGAAAKKQRIRE